MTVYGRVHLCVAFLLIATLSGCGGGGSCAGGALLGGLSACGGSGGSSPSASPASALSTGTFVDSPVVGINYKTETQSGQTDANGNFNFLPGENVTFSVGAVKLPTIAAKATITPLDLANTTDLNNQVAVNITVFLQSLNQSADPTRSIVISPQANTAATKQIDFAASSATFSANTELLNLVKNSGSANASLVSEASAKAQLQATLSGKNGTPKINIAPVADAGIVQSVTVGATVNLTGADSRDANGDSLTYAWTFVSKPAGSSATLTNPTSINPIFVPDVNGSYVVGLTVNDGSLESPVDTVNVIVAAANQPPIANPGAAQSVTVGSTVTLNGASSSDPENDPLTYSWTFVSKPTGSSATFTNPTSVVSTFVADVAGSYVVGLTVNDGKVNGLLATTTITSSPANAPTPTADGSASSPFIESTLVAAGNLNPNGFVKSTASGKVFDLRWGKLDAPTSLSNADNVTLTVQSQSNAVLQFQPLNAASIIYSVPDAFYNSVSTNLSSLASQNQWITQSILTAWAAGLDGSNINVAIIDDFTVNDVSEVGGIPLPNATCLNVTAGGATVSYCPTTNFLFYTMTHGQEVSLIIGGLANSSKLLWSSTGPYAYLATPTIQAGTLTTYQLLTATLSTPIYGIAYGANATTKRDDYLTYQANTNGLFNQLQIWGAGTDAASLSYQNSKVVNLSLGGTANNPIVNTSIYALELTYANASTVPDAVFVKAAANSACTISDTNCDPDNAVFYGAANYKSKTLIVGALTAAGGTIASYSNLAGNYADRFVVADGRGLQKSDGTFSEGTSFAAPRVAGYVAILRQKYPNLSAADTAAIILSTAKWNPAWGPKTAANQAIYGQGEADLGHALSAIGSLP